IFARASLVGVAFQPQVRFRVCCKVMRMRFDGRLEAGWNLAAVECEIDGPGRQWIVGVQELGAFVFRNPLEPADIDVAAMSVATILAHGLARHAGTSHTPATLAYIFFA